MMNKARIYFVLYFTTLAIKPSSLNAETGYEKYLFQYKSGMPIDHSYIDYKLISYYQTKITIMIRFTRISIQYN